MGVDQVHYMKAGVVHIPAIFCKMEFWEHEHPTVESQTFDSLSLTLQITADNLGSSVLPSTITSAYTEPHLATAMVENIPTTNKIFC